MTKHLKNVRVAGVSVLKDGAIPAVPEAENKFSIVKMFTGLFKKTDEKLTEAFVERLDKFAETIEEITKKVGRETTDDMYRYRIKEPGLFDENSFRTVTIQKKPTVKSVMGKLTGEKTMTMQNLMFPTKEWTLKEAKARVKEHKDTITKSNTSDYLICKCSEIVNDIENK